MATQTTEFSAVGVSNAFGVNHGDSIDWTTALASGTNFEAVVRLERSTSLNTWEPIVTVTDEETSGRYVCEHPGRSRMFYRWNVVSFGESGDPINLSIADVAKTLYTWRDQEGGEVFEIREGGVYSAGTLTVAGAASFESTTAFTGTAVFSATIQVDGVTASNVTKAVLGADGNALVARCATANIPTGAGYAKGCLLVASDGTDHTNTLFCNIGNATTANFNAVTIASD